MPRVLSPLRLYLLPKTRWFFISVTFCLLSIHAPPGTREEVKVTRFIAGIAETKLSDAAGKRIKELLRKVLSLADASTWPDKTGRRIPDMNPYHYVNLPKDANTYDQQAIAKLATASSKLLRGMCRW